jgi:phage shock protein C
MSIQKKLYLSDTHRMIGGVCGGIGEYFDIDPTVIRVAWVIFALMGGAGLIAYLIAWIIIPRKPRLEG